MVKSKTLLKPFNRDLLFATLYESCKHRPTGLRDATSLTQNVISQVIKKQKSGIVERDDIALAAHLALKRIDKVAAVFYAAYHSLP